MVAFKTGLAVIIDLSTLWANSADNNFMTVCLFFSRKHGPSCSKLTMSLVNDSLKFPSSDT